MQFSTSNGLFKLCEWMYRLVYLNLVATAFTLIGGVIFGVFPAIAAMLYLINKWQMGIDDFPVIKEFWKSYKHFFWQSNLLGGIILLSFVAIYIDFSLVQNFEGFLYYVILSSSATVFTLIIIVLLYGFGLMVTSKNNIYQYIVKAILISSLYPIQTAWIGVSLISFLFVCWVIPGFALLYFGSGLAFISMYFTNFALSRAHNKQAITSKGFQSIGERGVVHGR